MTKKPTKKAGGAAKPSEFERFDFLVRNVLSVSNVTVQKKLKAEKRKRQAKRTRRASK